MAKHCLISNPSVQNRADKDVSPRLYQALYACRWEASNNAHGRPPISDWASGRPVALLRNKKRAIGTDHWTQLELKALPDVATANLVFIVRQTDIRLTIQLQRLTNLMCVAQAWRRREADRATVLCCVSCGAAATPSRSASGMRAGRVSGTLRSEVQRPAMRQSQETLARRGFCVGRNNSVGVLGSARLD